ncbi:hypothetical protein Asp14428_35530 [Actinoplanes sp. NBRC 14428]|nr:hypothetical protein Asp14428_35530 [Actinoplanes sp. NBRC 14428]
MFEDRLGPVDGAGGPAGVVAPGGSRGGRRGGRGEPGAAEHAQAGGHRGTEPVGSASSKLHEESPYSDFPALFAEIDQNSNRRASRTECAAIVVFVLVRP